MRSTMSAGQSRYPEQSAATFAVGRAGAPAAQRHSPGARVHIDEDHTCQAISLGGGTDAQHDRQGGKHAPQKT
jgi:hypothetical protein